MKNFKLYFGCMLLAILTITCTSVTSKKQQKMESNAVKDTMKGSYGYDVAFMKSHNKNVIELRDKQNKACLLISPELQGRVMTSSAKGNEGASFGWINYKLIESGKVSCQFNPYGGEERLWFGPEGGPFSIYFQKGKEQVFANWQVPAEIAQPWRVDFRFRESRSQPQHPPGHEQRPAV